MDDRPIRDGGSVERSRERARYDFAADTFNKDVNDSIYNKAESIPQMTYSIDTRDLRYQARDKDDDQINYNPSDMKKLNTYQDVNLDDG